MSEQELYDLRLIVHEAQYNTDLMAAALGCTDWTHGAPPNWTEAERITNKAMTALTQVLAEIKKRRDETK